MPHQKHSKIAKNERDLVTEQDIVQDYMTTQTVAIGSEIEHMVFAVNDRLITPAEHETLKEKLLAAGVPTTDEPLASIFEVKSRPSQDPETIMAEMAAINGMFESCIRSEGYRPVRTGYIGHTDLPDAIAHRMPFERSNGLIEHFMNNGNPMHARLPLMTSSVHISISFADIEHAYDVGKTLMVLTPPLVALCEQTDGAFDGKPCAFNPSATVRLRHAAGHGGLSTSLTEAENAHDMIRRHVHHIFTTPMVMHIDKSEEMRVLDERGRQPSLNDLRAHNLNTRSNAMLTESMQYHMLKLTSLRNREGRMTGKRLELRMADNGPFQHDFMVLLAAAIATNAPFRKKVQSGLAAAGLDPFSPQTGALAEKALEDVAADRDGAMRTMFGKSSVGDICRIMLDSLEEHYSTASLPVRAALQQTRRAFQVKCMRVAPP